MGEETARLRIVQITDVYTLKNFPHLKTLLHEKRAEIDKLGGKTISMLTGDFLAPYLLSSFDKGQGMVNILNKTPIEYVIWGNHEHDLGKFSRIIIIFMGPPLWIFGTTIGTSEQLGVNYRMT